MIDTYVPTSFFSDVLYNQVIYSTTPAWSAQESASYRLGAKTERFAQTLAGDDTSFFSTGRFGKQFADKWPQNCRPFPVLESHAAELASPIAPTKQIDTSFAVPQCNTPSPKIISSSLAKTLMCVHILRKKQCPYGSGCLFAHSVQELKTKKVDRNFKWDICQNRAPHSNINCYFKHPKDFVNRNDDAHTIDVFMKCDDGSYRVYLRGWYQ